MKNESHIQYLILGDHEQRLRAILSQFDEEILIKYFYFAIQKKKIKAVNAFITYGLSPMCTNSHGYRPIHIAAKFGADLILKRLITEYDIPANVEIGWGINALHIAAENGHLACVKVLIEYGMLDPQSNNQYALHWASRKGHLDVVRYLMDVHPSAIKHHPKKLPHKYKVEYKQKINLFESTVVYSD